MSSERIGPVGRLVRAGALVVAIAAVTTGCGRRGPLEPPSPDPSAATAPAAAAPSGRAAPADTRLRPTTSSSSTVTPATRQARSMEDSPDDEEDVADSPITVSPNPTPRKRVKPYVVPKESFFLDPLL